jgi:hypothetical protein
MILDRGTLAPRSRDASDPRPGADDLRDQAPWSDRKSCFFVFCFTDRICRRVEYWTLRTKIDHKRDAATPIGPDKKSYKIDQSVDS